MARIGARLRGIRQHLRLSLREVERRSRRIAEERGDSSYQVSASWLDRLERSEHELTVNKLLALAEIYNIPIDQLLGTLYPRRAEPQNPDQLSGPNATEVQTEGSQKVPVERSRAARPPPVLSPDEATLLPTENVSSRTRYLRVIIGKNSTLDPMIPAGSNIQIDTSKREISPKKDWTHNLQRPIYFLKTKDGYFCGWCELDENSQWLTLIPHPLSSAPSRRWRYGTEVESLGRVVAVTVRLPE
jgi:transcriptional regulator with XRE-family HTH domain